MTSKKLPAETLELLNGKIGLRTLMAYKNVDYVKAKERILYEKKIAYPSNRIDQTAELGN